MIVSNEVVRDPRVLREAQSLQRHGHDVRVVGWDRFDPSQPPRPVLGGLAIELVQTRGLLGAIPTTPLRTVAWWRRAYRKALTRPMDVVHCHDLDALPAGVRLKRKRGATLVYDAHELFPAMIQGDYPAFVVRTAQRLEDRLVPQVDALVTVNPAMARRYADRYGVEATIVMNCREDVLPKYVPPEEETFTVLYVGTFHRARFVLELVRAVQAAKGLRLLIGGQKALASEIRKACARSPRTRYLGRVPSADVMPLTVRCHAVCAMLDPQDPNNRVGTPNKLFEGMAAGRPVLATAGTLCGDIVAEEGCGLALPYDEDAFRDALVALSQDDALQRRLGENGLRAARRTYNWPEQERRLLALYDKLGVERQA
jgi:glycosyltransferase involved in cell wall biosynthesis